MPSATATNSANTSALVQRVDELEKLVIALNEKIQLLESTPKKAVIEVNKKESKGLKKDGTPRKKRAPCGYMIFSNEKRSEIREELVAEADGEKVPPGAVVKKLAELWNALGEDEKEPYNTRAKEMSIESEEE
jgi:hypothetical protein